MTLPGPRGRVAPVHPPMRNGVVIGDLYMTSAQVRSELDRVDRRMRAALASAMSIQPITDATRLAFFQFWNGWRDFYQSARADVLAWGTNVSEAQRYDQELDSWRERLRDVTGREVGDPTSSRTVARDSGIPWGTLALVGGLAAVAAIYASTRNAGPVSR